MTQEEKAKAYDEAYKRVAVRFGTYIADGIFPELRESEDEKIRKRLIAMCEHYIECYALDPYNIDNYKEALAWLKKQGEQKHKIQPKFKIGDIIRFKGEAETHKIISYDNELYVFADGTTDLFCEQDLYELVEQKPTDKVEPNFKVGDWVVTDKGDTVQIGAVNNGYYTLFNGMDFNMSYVDKCWHRWTIKDAKDGDVLIGSGNVKYSNGVKYERIYLFNNFDNAYFTLTKFSNYAEEYDIDVNVDYPDNTVPATKEQKEILFMVMKEAGYEWDIEKKELIKLEQKPTWSEEDKEMCQETIDWFKKKCFPYALENDNPARESIKWLKSLKNRVILQPTHEWSEDDETHRHWILEMLKAGEIKTPEFADHFKAAFNWLKSLRPQNHLKPTEEQMEALLSKLPVIKGSGDKVQDILQTLYDDLKAL